MSTAQYICMETVRNVLIKLLCDEKKIIDKDQR